MRNKPDGAWSRSESVTLVRPRVLVSELVVMVVAGMVKINLWEWLQRAGVSGGSEGCVAPRRAPSDIRARRGSVSSRYGGAGALSHRDALCFVSGFERGGNARRSVQLKVRA
jgi:hypothetical protein